MVFPAGAVLGVVVVVFFACLSLGMVMKTGIVSLRATVRDKLRTCNRGGSSILPTHVTNVRRSLHGPAIPIRRPTSGPGAAIALDDMAQAFQVATQLASLPHTAYFSNPSSSASMPSGPALTPVPAAHLPALSSTCDWAENLCNEHMRPFSLHLSTRLPPRSILEARRLTTWSAIMNEDLDVKPKEEEMVETEEDEVANQLPPRSQMRRGA